MAESWDVIVVGARCSGATLAALLARRGLKVALLEAAARGTDMPMSTHYLQPPALAVLDRLGVGDRARGAAPPTRRASLAFDDLRANVPTPEDRPAYCVRRSLLDPWLQQAAAESGATLFDHHRVVELLREGPRVCGVIARTTQGNVELRAPLVVGADGPRSTIAELTAAEEYLVSEGSRAGYWSYYPAPAAWTADWDAIVEHRGDELRYVFRADGDLVVLVYMGPSDDTTTWGKEYQTKLRAALERSETTRALCEGKSPVGKTMGILSTRFFYRKPIGLGWALVGDAGHFKDFVTGHGITDALVDAEHLSDAIVDGRPEAFELYWRERDVRTLPLHFDAIRQGEVGYNTPMMRCLIAGVAKRPDLIERMTRVFDRTLDPHELIPMPTMLSMIAKALLRGRFGVLPGFLQTGRRLQEEARELSRRRQLAEDARAKLARAFAAQASIGMPTASLSA